MTQKTEIPSNTAFLGSVNDVPFYYPLSNLKKHFISLGASGSGKTVLSKILVEECARNRIPSIVVDVQGDLSSLALFANKESLQTHNISPELYNQFTESTEVIIYTPVSSKGIPLCINPLELDRANIPQEESISILHAIASSLAKLLGYNTQNDQGKTAEAILYHMLQFSYDAKTSLTTFTALSQALLSRHPDFNKRLSGLISEDEKEIHSLVKKIRLLDIGEKKLLFQFGVSLSIDVLLGKKSTSNKTPISVIYLNTLQGDDEKEFFLTSLTTKLYQWMLAHPSDSLQCAYLIDEIAPFLPAGSEKPMPKTILKMLFKQARKYGVGCLIATQNPGDIDYKAFAQFGTWAIGRLTVRQDIKKIEQAFRSMSGDIDFESELPSLEAGNFLLFAPDISKDLLSLKARWLYTEHKTLNEEHIKKIMDGKRPQFDSLLNDLSFSSQKSKTTISKEEVELEDNDDSETEINESTKENTYNSYANQTIKEITAEQFDKQPKNPNEELCLCTIRPNEVMIKAHALAKKQFILFGQPKESVLGVTTSYVPHIIATVRANESYLFGLVRTKKSYKFVINTFTGEFVRLGKKTYRTIPFSDNLLDLTENQLSIARLLMRPPRHLSIAEIVYKTEFPQNTVTRVVNELVERKKLVFETIDKYKKYFSKNPFPAKYIFQLRSKNPLSTSIIKKVAGKKPIITEQHVYNFIHHWFKHAAVIKTVSVKVPMYEITFAHKRSVRKIVLHGYSQKTFER